MIGMRYSVVLVQGEFHLLGNKVDYHCCPTAKNSLENYIYIYIYIYKRQSDKQFTEANPLSMNWAGPKIPFVLGFHSAFPSSLKMVDLAVSR